MKPETTIQLSPIGIIHTPYVERYHAPRQPGMAVKAAEGIITLFPDHNFEQALQDLDGFERIWVLFWFHKNTKWRPKVLPPRSGRVKRGVFATRSPHRPNPIGLSLCKLISIEGRNVRIENPDLLDGTPILDLKPYIPYAEAFPDSRSGWLEELQKKTLPPFAVTVEALAAEQACWLEEEHDIHLLDRVSEMLSRDPFPHSSRRIKVHPEGGYIMGSKSWRIRFSVEGERVLIQRIESGYPPEALTRAKKEHAPLHDEQAHRQFQKRWGEA